MTVCAYSFKKYTCFKENYFSLKLFRIFSFKIFSITQDPDLDLEPDLDPNCAKILDRIWIQIQCIWIHNTAFYKMF